MNEMSSFLEELHTRESGGRGKKNSTKGAISRWLRSVIVDAKAKEKSLLKNPKKETVSFDPEDGPQPTTNKDKANDIKKVRKRATKMLSGMGGGGGSINTPDETARRGRMSLLRRSN